MNELPATATFVSRQNFTTLGCNACGRDFTIAALRPASATCTHCAVTLHVNYPDEDDVIDHSRLFRDASRAGPPYGWPDEHDDGYWFCLTTLPELADELGLPAGSPPHLAHWLRSQGFVVTTRRRSIPVTTKPRPCRSAVQVHGYDPVDA